MSKHTNKMNSTKYGAGAPSKPSWGKTTAPPSTGSKTTKSK